MEAAQGRGSSNTASDAEAGEGTAEHTEWGTGGIPEGDTVAGKGAAVVGVVEVGVVDLRHRLA